MNKKAVFGTGDYGKRALYEFGPENIACFIDNNTGKQGTEIDGVPVVGLDGYKEKYGEYRIIIASTYIDEIADQLDREGIQGYLPYLPKLQYFYPPDVLIDNPYTTYRKEASNESEWNESVRDDRMISYINRCVELIKDEVPLFSHVEIETYNRCNGGCEFCPVSVQNEKREERLMDEKLFKKIIGDLKEISYDGRIALFSNNEPFLDERIIDFHEYARKELPDARFHLYTNGTLLTLEKFIEIMKYLDELIIDNYNQNLELIPNNRRIKEYCEEHPELIKKVTIVMRKPQEILTSRGGDAPNRKEMVSYSADSCLLPFRQMIIRPDGKVSLCCNDPLGKVTLGDLNNENIMDIWYGEPVKLIREKISKGRGNFGHCEFCDSFIVG